MLRTHNCGEINDSLVGKEVILCGWVASRRDHGKIVFIDLRDRYGIIQVVFTPKPYPDTYAKAKKLKNEDVVRIKGEINIRPQGTENPNLPAGNIELFSHDLEILSESKDLPFPIEDEIDVGEDIRLEYRYLDLRRRKIIAKLELRNNFNYAFREFLHSSNFLEVETPFLAKSTPEGARDFLIPSRLNPTKFYALPQSPQLFKQILMVSGIDRYYQIVKCFRDEDLRRDRQPEFTQLDMELSFIEEEDIFRITEEMFAFAFDKVLGVKLELPFKRITYAEAIEKYGSDKPDFGEGDYRFLWITDFPLFEYNEEEKRWVSQHHPFTAPNIDDETVLFQDLDVLQKEGSSLGKVRARSYDLVLNGEEIASGSIRIHSQSLQQRIFEIINIPLEEQQERFGFLLKAFQYGVPPHGGIAFGLDRLYAIISKSTSIRDVIAFPKTQKGVCPMTDAPSSVDMKQLKELFIKIDRK